MTWGTRANNSQKGHNKVGTNFWSIIDHAGNAESGIVRV